MVLYSTTKIKYTDIVNIELQCVTQLSTTLHTCIYVFPFVFFWLHKRVTHRVMDHVWQLLNIHNSSHNYPCKKCSFKLQLRTLQYPTYTVDGRRLCACAYIYGGQMPSYTVTGEHEWYNTDRYAQASINTIDGYLHYVIMKYWEDDMPTPTCCFIWPKCDM